MAPENQPSSSGDGSHGGEEPANQAFVASTAQLTFTDFLEKMRAPAAMDLVRMIKSFIAEILNSRHDSEGDSKKIQDFLAATEVAFRNHPLWAGSAHEEVEAAGEGLEKYLLTKLYNRCFAVSEDDRERDELLAQRMAALGNFIKPDHLDIPETFWNEQSWVLAQKELQKINTYKAPRDKLVCVLNCCRVISNMLSVATKEGSAAGADDFLPILIYVLIKANPPQLESNLAFVRRYRLASRFHGEAAYFYTNMVSASSFIETITANSLSIDPSEFIAHMQAAGVPGSSDRSAEAPAAAPTVPSGEDTPSSRDAAPTITATPTSNGAPGDAGERMSITAPPLPPLEDLQASGASLLAEAERAGDLHIRHRFLYASASDLRVKDVAALLEDYKELALRHEALRLAYQQLPSAQAQAGAAEGTRGRVASGPVPDLSAQVSRASLGEASVAGPAKKLPATIQVAYGSNGTSQASLPEPPSGSHLPDLLA